MKKRPGAPGSSKKVARPAIMLDEPVAWPPAAAAPASSAAPEPKPHFEPAALAEAVEAALHAAAPPEPPVAATALAPAVETAEAEPAAPAAETVQAAQENLHAILEKGVSASRSRFAEARSSADDAVAAVEASLEAAREGVARFNVKAIEALKAGADANFDLFASLASAKTLSQLVTIQTEFARACFEDASQRAKELAGLARQVADETVAPIKAQVEKSFKA